MAVGVIAPHSQVQWRQRLTNIGGRLSPEGGAQCRNAEGMGFGDGHCNPSQHGGLGHSPVENFEL